MSQIPTSSASGVRWIKRLGSPARWEVVGDTCCHFIDARGHVVDELAERSTGISVEEIKATPLRIAVAGGADKLVPLLAALRSGMPNVLITDVDTARMLLAAADPERES